MSCLESMFLCFIYNPFSEEIDQKDNHHWHSNAANTAGICAGVGLPCSRDPRDARKVFCNAYEEK